jgi:lauroyl/myristoyl acyltransferase
VLATVTRPLRRHGIAAEPLAEVFPDLPPEARRVVRQRTWECFLKGEAVEAGVGRGFGPGDYPRIVPNPAVSALPSPIIVASFHVGPFQALGAVVRTLPGELVAVDRGQFGPRPDVTMLRRGDDEWERARTFNRALSTLRRGGAVVVTVDGFHPDDSIPTIEVPMLGRSLPLARGAFALARISRTRVVPIVTRWRGTAMEVTVGDPIAPDLGEAGMAAAVGAWVEGYLRRRPGEVSVFLLERLLPPLGL